ncbi:MAG: hypothetical protein M1828_002785 [Chrysothrix sp. TS-e1954]|nr:MAG: hypothetical protein M1828_002785 [Chrysothrix sp. TS-e1954]
MRQSIIATGGLLAAIAHAKQCVNITVPVTISARTGVFDNINTPETALDVTTFIQQQTRQGANLTETALSGYTTTSGTYNISGKYCTPGTGTSCNSSSSILQVLTHGIGFDKTYWDLSYNNFNYSYINSALDAGYSTFSYDRLGIGNSSHGEPKNEIQAPLEIEALATLTRMLRSGSLPGVSANFSKIVHVGHSFGSSQTFALTAKYPNISDGIVLTGFSTNGSFVPYFGAGADFQQANLNQPLRFGSMANAMALNTFTQNYALTDLLTPIDVTTIKPLNYPNGYLANSNVNSQQYLFLLPPYFDNGILYAGEQAKQPVTIGELLTLGSVPKMNTFSGPVLVVTGSNDLPYCGGDCLNTGGSMASIPAGVKMGLPQAKNFEAYIQPNSGHGINFHYNSTGAYQVIQNYLKANGL